MFVRLMHHTRQFLLFLFGATCVVLVGCREARQELAIRSAHAQYKSWLVEQKPVLTNLPPAAIYEYNFTTIQDGSTIRPIIDYYVKAGDWDGLLNLTFVIDINARRQPTRLREQRITFIGLPARETVIAEAGRRRTRYYGLKLKPSDMPTVVARAARGDDFDDLRVKADRHEELVVSRFEDSDDWKKLTSK